MKQLLTLLLIAPLFIQAQIYTFIPPSDIRPLFPSADSAWSPFNYDTLSVPLKYSVYDTTILFNGIDTITHEHEWLSDELPYRYSSQSGIPFFGEEFICYICLRNFKVEERIIDKFKEAKERLTKLQK